MPHVSAALDAEAIPDRIGARASNGEAPYARNVLPVSERDFYPSMEYLGLASPSLISPEKDWAACWA